MTSQVSPVSPVGGILTILTTLYRHPVDILHKVIAKMVQAAASRMISVSLEVRGRVRYLDYTGYTHLQVGRCR